MDCIDRASVANHVLSDFYTNYYTASREPYWQSFTLEYLLIRTYHQQWIVEEDRYHCCCSNCFGIGLAAVAGCIVCFRTYLHAQEKPKHNEVAKDLDNIKVVPPEEVLEKRDLEHGLPKKAAKMIISFLCLRKRAPCYVPRRKLPCIRKHSALLKMTWRRIDQSQLKVLRMCPNTIIRGTDGSPKQ